MTQEQFYSKITETIIGLDEEKVNVNMSNFLEIYFISITKFS